MDALTRRKFLIGSGVVGGAALAAGTGAFTLAEILKTASWQDKPDGARTLVLVTLYGGNDGLATVIPYADPAYHDARPELAYKPEEVLHLDDKLGLNPGMKGFADLFKEKRVAIVRGVEYAKPDHSHFRSMAIWQTASPETSVPTGWLGRWLDASGDDPLRAVSVEPVLPPMLAGARTAAASLPVGGLTLPTGGLGKSFQGLGAAQPGEGFWQARAARSIGDLYRAQQVLGGAAHTKKGAKQPKGALAAQLDVVAGLIEAGVPTRAYSVSLGGFDTHADERGTQQRLLTELDGALTPFVQRLGRTDRGKQAVVLVYSEFGRRVTANASQGTDHGTAGPVFVLGNGVRGGFHGAEPSLTDLDNGDLKESTDFRDVYATLLEKVLGTEAGRILPGHSGRLEALLA